MTSFRPIQPDFIPSIVRAMNRETNPDQSPQVTDVDVTSIWRDYDLILIQKALEMLPPSKEGQTLHVKAGHDDERNHPPIPTGPLVEAPSEATPDGWEIFIYADRVEVESGGQGRSAGPAIFWYA